MTLALIALVIGILGGGYGGYKVGRNLEKKAQAVLAMAGQAYSAAKAVVTPPAPPKV